MRYLGWLLTFAIASAGCANRTVVQTKEGVDFGRYHRIGVVPFSDHGGRGQRIAGRIEDSLRKLHFDIADGNALEKILAKHRPDAFYGIDLEMLNQLRTQTSADAIVLGSVANDRRQATISFIDTESGDTVLSATLKPGRGKKEFATPDEVADEAMFVLSTYLSPA